MKTQNCVRLLTFIAAFFWSAAAQDSTQSQPVQVANDKIIERFEVNNADIHSVLKQLSEFSGVDIVAAENVKCNVTLQVSNKSWTNVLTIICKVSNLIAINEGSYFYVLTNEEFQKRQLANATNTQATDQISPLKREIIRVKHAPATELKTSLENLLSSRGKITVVEHNNALIVYDTDENISQIRRMVQELDIETPQISISCKIIEVSTGAIQRIGVSWGAFDRTRGVTADQFPQKTGFVSGAFERLTYGIISPEKFSAALEYLFTDNHGEIVAQPQITTLDNKEAKIFMGQQIPVKYLDEAGNTVVKMINAGTQLIVTPHISGEGRILMALSPKKESYTLQSDGNPIINEQSASTSVVVNNGETVVIAGLTSNETQKVDNGIPFLKDIPIIGYLFKKSDKTVDKKDLIIFVTPNIIIDKAANVPAQVKVEKKQSNSKAN
jgi:type II secretory pathway component HofQ